MKANSNILKDALRTARPVFIALGLFSFVINLLMLVVPVYSLQVLDRVLSTGSTETLLWLSAIMVAVFAASGLLQCLRSFALVKVSEWLGGDLGQTLFSSSLTHAASTGIRGTQNLRDLNTVKGFFTGNGLLTLFDAPWSVISLAVVFMIHVQLGVLVLLGCLMLLGLAWLNEMAMHAPLDEANERNVKNFQHIDIAMRNAESVEAMGMTEAIAQRWRIEEEKVTVLQSRASQRSVMVQGVIKFMRLNLQIAITGWGAYLVLQNEMTSGGIIAASILGARALAPFDAAVSTWKVFVETRKAYDRLCAALASIASKPEGIRLPPCQGNLSVEHVYFGIAGRTRPILKGVHFNLKAGESLGVVGPSAAGKSTLAKLIIGAWKPYAGVVRLEGADVCQWKRDEFGQSAGYLPQDVELFSGSVRDNIARLGMESSDEDVVSAAQMARAHEMILSLPQGYDTDIGPGGAALSAGQRQRIGLARAFFGDPKLLVLDEPDASLDMDGEIALGQALKAAKENQITTIVVTHRRTLLAHMGKLLVLKDGEMALFGATEEVLATLNRGERSLQPHQIPKPEVYQTRGENYAAA